MTTTKPNYADSQLSALLKSETAQEHSKAENSQFMTQLLEGQLDIRAVAELTSQLYFIYEALEQAVRANRHAPEIAAVYDPRLERLDALRNDLTYLYGDDWQEHIAPLPETQMYVSILREIEENQSAAEALAHHYVRYLGDMSGGQVIAKMLNKHYGLDSDGTSFYQFDAIGRIKPYRDNYRIQLNELTLDAEQKKHIVGAAKAAFELNRSVFQGLDQQRAAS